MVKTWPAVYASLLKPVDPITSRKSCDKSFLHRCKSQSCSIFISATPSIIGPSCSIIAQYLAWPGRQNGSLPYMGLLQPDPSIAGYRAMWQGFNSSVHLKAFPPLLV